MTEFENKKKAFIWCDRSDYHAGQILALKKLWIVDFEIFTTTSKL